MTDTPCSAGGSSRRFVAGSFAFLISIFVVALVVLSILPMGSKRAEASNISTPWTVSVTPFENISDGTRIRINLRTDSAHLISSARAQVCRSGVNYATSTSFVPNEDFRIGGANCPSIPISTSGDLAAQASNTYTNAVRPEGDTFTIAAGVGTVTWNDTNGAAQSLTCDAQNPCDLVIQVRGIGNDNVLRWIPFTQPLTYRIDDPIAGCGGPASGLVSSASSERNTRLWVDLTLAQCKSPGAQTGALSSASFAGEGSALEMYSRGDVDFVYSSVGYDSAAGFGRGDSSDPMTPRESALVPVALNATVLAVGNGYQAVNGDKVPYSDVKMTLDEVAALLSGGPAQIDSYLPDIYARNPQIQGTGMFSTSSSIQLGAVPDKESTTWYATGILDSLRPNLWKVPNTGTFGADAGRDRTALTSFALADPSFQGVLNLFTGTSILDKTIKSLGNGDFGGVWAVTDLATARSLGMTVVQIQNASGAFVEPTQASMLSAVSSMTTASDGRLVPNYSAAAVQNVEPYPLTFVEYAVAPLKPLVDDKCVPRTTSQQLLKNWLTYVTQTGQQNLPDGMEAITPSMLQTAEAQIALIGTVDNSCVLEPTAQASDGGLGPVTPPPALTSRFGSSAARVAPAGSTVAVDAQLASVQAEMPDFVRRSVGTNALALVGLAAVLGLLTVSAMATSGRLSLSRFGRGGRRS